MAKKKITEKEELKEIEKAKLKQSKIEEKYEEKKLENQQAGLYGTYLGLEEGEIQHGISMYKNVIGKDSAMKMKDREIAKCKSDPVKCAKESLQKSCFDVVNGKIMAEACACGVAEAFEDEKAIKSCTEVQQYWKKQREDLRRKKKAGWK